MQKQHVKSFKLVILIFVLVCVVCVQFVLMQNAIEPERVPPPLPDFGAEAAFNEYWSHIVNTRGAQQAYQDVLQVYQSETVSNKHTIAHLFGNVLYQLKGSDALYVCDESYSFGCYHEVLSQIILTNGIDILPDLADRCGHHTGCQHGIGHGLLTFLGYEKDNLTVALEKCAAVSSIDPVDGCVGGVFMEHNLRAVASADGISPRDPVVPYLPDEECVNEYVFESARSACYFWLSQWAVAVATGTLEDRFRQAAIGCASSSVSDHILTCLNGLGYEVPLYVEGVPAAKKLCESATAGLSELYSIQCKAAAAAGLFLQRTYQNEALAMCSGVNNQQYYEYCKKSARHDKMQRIVNFQIK